MRADYRVQKEQQAFNDLRDQLVWQTLVYWKSKPLQPEAWKGITRGVEFARQCRSVQDFERKWISRQKQGLGLMDAWSVFACDQPRPDPAVEAQTVNTIYTALLFGTGANHEYSQADREFASLAITKVAIRKAKQHAASPAP